MMNQDGRIKELGDSGGKSIRNGNLSKGSEKIQEVDSGNRI